VGQQQQMHTSYTLLDLGLS